MACVDYTIKDLKGVNGYQFLQVMYFLLRSAYYSPETNDRYKNIEEFFKYVGELKDEDLDKFVLKIATICADVTTEYWDIIFRMVEYKGSAIIPESIQTIPAEDLVYIISEGMKKVLAIKFPF